MPDAARLAELGDERGEALVDRRAADGQVLDVGRARVRGAHEDEQPGAVGAGGVENGASESRPR